MKHYIAFIAVSLLTLAACSNQEPTAPPKPGNTDTAAVMLTINFKTSVGTTPFAFDSTMTSESGANFKISMLRFYVTQPRLIDSAGAQVAVQFVDTAGKPIPYGIALVDHAKQESLTLRVMAKRGTYKGLDFSIGVPLLDEAGNALNHGDASTKEYPLDVDADMYWGWNPGYIFLKVEGRAQIVGKWEPFYYHIGDDKRFMTIKTTGPVKITGDGKARTTLLVNVNRLFVTPGGDHKPNIVGGLSDRIANNGIQTDVMATNVVSSGFITLEQ